MFENPEGIIIIMLGLYLLRIMELKGRLRTDTQQRDVSPPYLLRICRSEQKTRLPQDFLELGGS